MSPIALEPPDVDTRDFATWLEDYMNDATTLCTRSGQWFHAGMAEAAREILERYRQEQEQNDDRDA